nr:hypothetical protein [Verminephrobacter eiseniae]
MLSPRYILPLHDELVIDLFAGGGGASCGIEQAIGRSVDVAINHGQPIQWPAPTHGDPRRLETKARGLIPWRSAAECIDWTLPTPSIFERARPLADATLRRIARGIVKYVIEARQPFLVSLTHGEPSPSGVKPWGSGNGAARVAAFVSSYYGHKTEQGLARGAFIDEPVKTRTTANRWTVSTRPSSCTACTTSTSSGRWMVSMGRLPILGKTKRSSVFATWDWCLPLDRVGRLSLSQALAIVSKEGTATAAGTTPSRAAAWALRASARLTSGHRCALPACPRADGWRANPCHRPE